MAAIRLHAPVFALLFYLFLSGNAENNRPNIVFILTDDQDTFLGGMEPLVKTKRLLGERGMTFTNMFVNTPLCCPSRASILTGQYLHNTRVLNNSITGNCSSTAWQQTKERTEAFAPHIKQSGYKTFFAGKYLNQYGTNRAGGVEHVPPGWDEWHGLVGNSVYYDYDLSVNGRREKHGHDYKQDYLTDLIKRRAVNFIKNQTNENPFFMMLSTPSAHHPFTPAPQYNTTFANRRAPRTPTFNTHAADKHWLIRQPTHPMTQSSIDYTDYSFRNRWRTLLSVDDMVEDVIGQLKSRGLLDNTYVIFTSDNGFHLGQFSLPIDKRQFYEFDIRVPLIISGPGVPKNKTSDYLVMNIDLAPTFLDLIGVAVLPTMDGKSLKPILSNSSDIQWRIRTLIEHVGEYDAYDKWCPSKSGTGVAICFPNCVCEDSINNTYSCIRAAKYDVDYLYCELRDNEQFREFYAPRYDPHQRHNMIDQVAPWLTKILHEMLVRLRACQGTTCHQAESLDMPPVNNILEQNNIPRPVVDHL